MFFSVAGLSLSSFFSLLFFFFSPCEIHIFLNGNFNYHNEFELKQVDEER